MEQKKTRVNSIDALISGIPEALPHNPGSTTSPTPPAPTVSNTQKTEDNFSENSSSSDNFVENSSVNEKKSPDNSPNQQKNVETDDYGSDFGNNDTKKDAETPANTQSNQDTDEYGNALAKPKMYTEEEVQNKIRDRLKRVKTEQVAPTQQQVQQAASSGFEFDDKSEQSWSEQLENFVEKTMMRVNDRQIRKHQEAVAQHAQVEFEAKFHNGMGKYADFVDTLSDKPVTDNMMYAIRGLDNPAAFLYTVAKRAPKELERIANIADPYVQVAEMGRLHERLAKKKPSSNAPKPLSQDRSDISEKRAARVSIDHLIQQDANARYKR